jgi:hypothetical protein
MPNSGHYTFDLKILFGLACKDQLDSAVVVLKNVARQKAYSMGLIS